MMWNHFVYGIIKVLQLLFYKRSIASYILEGRKGILQMQPNKTFKDSVFRQLFSDPVNLLDIFNAIENTQYTDPSLVKITTLDNIFFNGIKNDVSFQIDNQFLILNEHQSSLNPNMPLRFFLYAAELYRQTIEYAAAYRSKLLSIPTPKFYTFYNGESFMEDYVVLKLSDAFTVSNEPLHLDLKVHAYNINYSPDRQLLQRCRPMKEYSLLVYKIRCNQSRMSLTDAITTAVRDCIKENILTSFLSANEKEVINMLNTEWDLDTALRVREQEGLEEGFARGITKTTKAIAMLLAGGKIDKIVHETGLPEHTVRELKQQFRP